MKKKLDITVILVNTFLMLLSLVIIIPLITVISASFTDNEALIKYGYRLIPSVFSVQPYSYIFRSPMIIVRAYGVTCLITVVGTVIGLLITTMTGYVISRKDYKFSKILGYYILFTMLFNGGLVANYIIVTKYFRLGDTVQGLILLGLVSPVYVLLTKGFMSKMSFEIVESAKIDGAGEWRIFVQIIIPLSKPVMATLGLFIAFNYWNEWFNAMLYMDNEKWIPIQLLLVRMMRSLDFLATNPELTGNLKIDRSNFPTDTVRMAMTVLAIGPMMFIFPFFQKYFVGGLTLGSVKG